MVIHKTGDGYWFGHLVVSLGVPGSVLLELSFTSQQIGGESLVTLKSARESEMICDYQFGGG